MAVAALLLPPIIGGVLGREALGGFLAGATLVGAFLALMMGSAGGAGGSAESTSRVGTSVARGRTPTGPPS